MNSLVIETLVGKLAYVGVNLLLQSRFWVFSNLHSPVGWHLTQKNLKFRQDFEAEVWLVFCCSFLVDVTKFNLGQVKILKLALAKILSLRMLTFGWDFEVNAKSRFWNLNLIKICVRTRDMNSTLGSVVPLAMFMALFDVANGIVGPKYSLSRYRIWVCSQCLVLRLQFSAQIGCQLSMLDRDQVAVLISISWLLISESSEHSRAVVDTCDLSDNWLKDKD